MRYKDQGNNNAISQVMSINPHSETLLLLSELQPVIEHELSILKIKQQEMANQISPNQTNQETKTQLVHTQNPPEIESTQKYHKIQTTKCSVQMRKQIQRKGKQLQKIRMRLKLLSGGGKVGQLSSKRVDLLQKIFKHYCNSIFKWGKHVTFERIQFEKQHLIMQRFFAFIYDFGLNKWLSPEKEQKQVMPKHELVLIFKKSAFNSRNLQFPQFISSLERLAILRYDYQQTYEQRKQKQQQERRRIREINLKREKQKQLRKNQRQLEIQQQPERLRIHQQQKLPKQTQLNNIQIQQNKTQTKEEIKLRKKKLDKNKHKKSNQLSVHQSNEQLSLPNNKQPNPTQNQIHSQEQTNNHSPPAELIINDQSNDHLVAEMLQNDQLRSSLSDNLQRQRLITNQIQINTSKDPNRSSLLALTKEEKVELIFRLMQLDNPKAVEAKLRNYDHPLFKQNALQRKASLLSDSSISNTKHPDNLRIHQLKSKLTQRKRNHFKLNLDKSITNSKYQQKTKDDYQNYLNKSLAASNLNLSQIKKRSLKKEQQDPPLSLNFLNQSSQSHLINFKLPFGLQKYLHVEEDDNVFLKQYGKLTNIRSSNSSYISKSPRYSLDLKKRVEEMEKEEKKQEEQKLERFSVQMYKNQHYMKRFLERRL